MKNIAFLLSLGFFFIACGHHAAHQAALYTCPMDCEKGKTYDHAGTCPVCKMDLTPKADPEGTTYACPMDCEKGKTYSQPGTCPVCKMNLEPVAPTTSDTTSTSPLKALQAETMHIHDEAMVEMAEMNRLKREMKDFMTRAKFTQEGLKRWNDALAAIDKAEADMMGWMAAYKEPAGLPEAEAMKYLQEQREKIAQNQRDIQAAIATGKELMGKK